MHVQKLINLDVCAGKGNGTQHFRTAAERLGRRGGGELCLCSSASERALTNVGRHGRVSSFRTGAEALST